MKLTDVLAHLRATMDQSHKFWGYYQGVTVAAVAFAWASTSPRDTTIFGLICGYAIFALLNCRLIQLSQKAALATWKAIQLYALVPAPADAIDSRFAPLLGLNKPDSPSLVTVMHLSLSALAAIAMWVRTLQPPAPARDLCSKTADYATLINTTLL